MNNAKLKKGKKGKNQITKGKNIKEGKGKEKAAEADNEKPKKGKKKEQTNNIDLNTQNEKSKLFLKKIQIFKF